ncbi:MAG: hypothetical protein IRZ28_01510 [Steroidobacteraceae bacterium]|nr:hypothetical protein [Steroidobacteraceae bacterium]
MTRPTIPGALSLDALARLHAPRTADEVRAAVHELRSRGYSDHTIARVTGLAVELVRRMLGEQREHST